MATVVDYKIILVIKIDSINTHSLCSGGANAFEFSRYTDHQTMSIRRWKSKTFLDYTKEELGCLMLVMPRNTKKIFKYINIRGDRWTYITCIVIVSDYKLWESFDEDLNILEFSASKLPAAK